jgi:putative acetyltransferase
MVYKDCFIRPASNRDIPAIKNVIFGVLLEYGLKPDDTGKDMDLNDLTANYFNNNGFFGVVVDANSKEIVGTFGLTQIDKNICELRKMYLLKHHRGKGLGKFMLQAAIDISKKNHYKKIILETIWPLKEAMSLYRQYGFSEISPHEITERVDRAFELNIPPD